MQSRPAYPSARLIRARYIEKKCRTRENRPGTNRFRAECRRRTTLAYGPTLIDSSAINQLASNWRCVAQDVTPCVPGLAINRLMNYQLASTRSLSLRASVLILERAMRDKRLGQRSLSFHVLFNSSLCLCEAVEGRVMFMMYVHSMITLYIQGKRESAYK